MKRKPKLRFGAPKGNLEGATMEKNLAKLLQTLPALRNPTVSNLSLSVAVAVETLIDEQVVRELIPRLKAVGAAGIIEYPVSKVV